MFADIDKVVIYACPEQKLIGSKGFSVLVDLIDEEHLLGAFKKDLVERILLLPIDKNEKLTLPIEIVNIIEYYGRRFYMFNEKGREFCYTYKIRWFDDYSSLIWINHSKYFERSEKIREEVEEVLGEKVEDVECKECPDKNGNDERIEEEEVKCLSEVIIDIIDERIDKKITERIDDLIGKEITKMQKYYTRIGER